MRQIMKETELASRSSLRGERLFMPGSVLGERPVTTEAVWKRFSSCQLQRNSLVRITLDDLHFDFSKRGSRKAVWAARIGPEVRYGSHEGLSRPSPAPLSWSAGSPGFA